MSPFPASQVMTYSSEEHLSKAPGNGGHVSVPLPDYSPTFYVTKSLLISGTWLSELRNSVAWTSLVSFLWYRKKWYPVLLQLQSSAGIWPFHTGAGTLIKPPPKSAKQHGLINSHKMVQSFLHTKLPPVTSSSQDQLTIQDWIAAERFSWKNDNIDRIRHFEELLQSTRDNIQWINSPVTDSMISSCKILSKNNP